MENFEAVNSDISNFGTGSLHEGATAPMEPVRTSDGKVTEEPHGTPDFSNFGGEKTKVFGNGTENTIGKNSFAERASPLRSFGSKLAKVAGVENHEIDRVRRQLDDERETKPSRSSLSDVAVTTAMSALLTIFGAPEKTVEELSR